MSPFLRFRGAARHLIRFTQHLPDRFERSRMWTPRSVMVWLLVLTMPARKHTYRSSLRMLRVIAGPSFGWARTPALSSIAQARKKLSPVVCRDLLEHVCEHAMGVLPPLKRFGGRRVIAFDGTRLITRHSADTVARLERYHRSDGSYTHNPQALMIMALDVERRLPLSWIVADKHQGEATAIRALLDQIDIGPGDIAVLDRGYASKKLFAELRRRGIDVVIRMKTSQTGWKEVTEFVRSKKMNAELSISFRKEQGPGQPLRARLVKRNLKPGPAKAGTRKERMVILTTLSEEDGYDRKAVVNIYQARWGIESLFRELKSFFDLEPFHGTTVDACEQELAAALIWMAIGSFLQALAEDGLGGRRVYRTDCLRVAADQLTLILEGYAVTDRLDRDIEDLRRYSSYAPREGRSAPRESKMPFGRSIQRGRAK